MVMLREPGGRSFVYNRHRWLWVPAFAGTTKWARRYSLTSSRTSERSERDPGPITTNGYVARTWGPQFCLQQASVVMGPRVRGDDKVGEALFPHVVPDK